MKSDSKIYIAGHRGLVGSAIVRALKAKGFHNLVYRTHAELDLTDPRSVDEFFETEQPDYVFLAAAKVGGIVANNSYPADFIVDNLAIEINVIRASHRVGVNRLLFLGSNCIYPKLADQPITEAQLLSGALEETNRPYALAKIAGIEMCWSFNRQYKTKYLSVMPINLYGPGDNYHPKNSHVLPALIRRFHEAKVDNLASVVVWGSGTPRREFMYSDDMADACLYLMRLEDNRINNFLGQDRNHGSAPLVNIGSGSDITIAELAFLIAKVIGYEGRIEFDLTKPDGTPKKLLDTSIMDTLGWKPRIQLEQGLTKAYEDFVAQGTRL